MLKQRVITAAIIVVLLLAALTVLPPPALSALFAVLVLLAAWEWSDLSGLGGYPARLAYVLLCGAVMALAAIYLDLFGGADTTLLRSLLLATCVWWAIALLWVQSYPGSAPIWGAVWARALMGLFVLAPAWLAVSFLTMAEQGVLLILLVIALVAGADIAAYFFGRAFGRAKLAPTVSPGKSWAGFWGGLGSSLLLAALLWRLWPGGMATTLPAMLLIAAFTVLSSVLGDLLESMVKRHRGIKDSGTLLPGHGGVMDRLDSLTAALPVFTLGLMAAGCL